jgi:hypothetical protein
MSHAAVMAMAAFGTYKIYRSSIMELTIIGEYDDLTHARSAKNDFLASGFSRSDLQLNPDHDLSAMRGPSVQ